MRPHSPRRQTERILLIRFLGWRYVFTSVTFSFSAGELSVLVQKYRALMLRIRAGPCYPERKLLGVNSCPSYTRVRRRYTVYFIQYFFRSRVRAVFITHPLSYLTDYPVVWLGIADWFNCFSNLRDRSLGAGECAIFLGET